MIIPRFSVVCLVGWLVAGVFSPSEALADRPVEFNRDIRPILSENCFLCHGPDKTDRKADLRLDVRQVALDKKAIVPEHPEDSEMVARIISEDPDEVMPPPSSFKTLTTDQKSLIRRWVAQGAKYQSHWAYEPIRRPEVPPVQRKAWVRNPIDGFILANLESRGIKPSPESDRPALIRRLSLDLLGLPPSPEEVEAFEADSSMSAEDHLVDRLLASPHYGERMAVPWLDLVRFADTVGYHGDQNQHVFPYRDYVINAFNQNMPFDRFSREQLAGDLLPDPTPDQRVATGFNRLNMMTREGGAQPKEYLAKYAGDRVRTVAITWLGSTMGCAECHDHKYDPFQARDFYRMAAFFADIQQWGVYMDYAYTPNPDLRGYSNDHPFPPEIEVESPTLRRQIAGIDRQIQQTLTKASTRVAGDPVRQAQLESWVDSTRTFLEKSPSGWVTPTASEPPGTNLQADGSLVIKGSIPALSIQPGAGWLASIRLELLPSLEPDGRIIRGSAVPTVLLSLSKKSADSSRSSPLEVFQADADLKRERFVNGQAVAGITSGWKLSPNDLKAPRSAVYQLQTPVLLAENEEIVVTIKGDGLARVRISVSPLVFEDLQKPVLNEGLTSSLRVGAGSRSTTQLETLRSAFLVATGTDPATLDAVHRLVRDRLDLNEGKAMSMVVVARDPLPTRVLPRGNWQDETGELVSPGVPGFLPQPPTVEGKRLNRLDLARWITSPENPLTARVFVNRLWKQFFGTGLSSVMEDVGAQGEWPSHSELLDWLASEFRESGWDVKHLVRLIVLSSTYRQESRLRPELREVDPSNRWLASQNPRRLEAEFIRDNALAISGLLNPEVGGPSVRPYQPPGYYTILQFPDRDYLPQRDDRQYRRGIYTHWQRTFLHPMLANFDAPSREECTASRTVANTPQQALTLLNDPTFVEASRVLAALVIQKAADDSVRLDLLFERALARKPRDIEAKSLRAFLEGQRREVLEHPEEARKRIRVGIAPTPPSIDEAELAVWSEVARVVLNLHETITRY